MATLVSIYGGPDATTTFSVIDSGKWVGTSTTLANGAALTTTQPWAGWVDATTATTIRVPLACVKSL